MYSISVCFVVSRVVVAVSDGNELVVVSLWFEVAARHAKTKLELKMSVNLA